MFELASHPCFDHWFDPETGLSHYTLIDAPGDLQKVFYFGSPGYRAGSEWLWFHACHLPSASWFPCAVNLNPDQAEIRSFPGILNHSQTGEHPLVIDDGQAIIAPMEDRLFRLDVNGECKPIFKLPGDIARKRHLFRLCTGVSMSCDERYLVMDCNVGNRWLILLLELATGEVKVLQDFPNKHHHCWFSPVDPNRMLIAQGPGSDPITGDRNPMHIRMWLMDIHGQQYEPLFPDLWFGHPHQSCHEFWTADGKVCWCDYESGVYQTEIEHREKELIWDRPLIHAHMDSTGRYLVGDYNPYRWSNENPCDIWFYDLEEQQETCLRSKLPVPELTLDQIRKLHVDPHPHFLDKLPWVAYTSSDGKKSQLTLAQY